MNKTYIISIPNKQQKLARELSRQSGRIYSKVVSTIFNLKQKKDVWLKENNMIKLIRLYSNNFKLHSQTKQSIVKQYYNNLNSYFKSKGENKSPPYKTKKYNKVPYKKSAINLKNDNILRFSNGRKGKTFKINVPSLTKKPKYAELIYNKNIDKYQMHIVIDIENKKTNYKNNKILAIDLGVIHPLVTFNGKKVKIYNGGKLNSYLRYRNKELARLQKKISNCDKYSNRWKKLNRARHKLLDKSKNKINDLLQKYTSFLIDSCLGEKISKIVIGDIKGIRSNINYRAKSNQKIHQWLSGKVYNLITYKAKSVGIKVKLQNEAYTTQTCPQCGNRYKPKNRNYNCPSCKFKYHRDGVGAINIWRKYLEKNTISQVEGVLASPLGIRYNPDLSCHNKWNNNPFEDNKTIYPSDMEET